MYVVQLVCVCVCVCVCLCVCVCVCVCVCLCVCVCVCVFVCVCVWFICTVQSNWACLTWKILLFKEMITRRYREITFVMHCWYTEINKRSAKQQSMCRRGTVFNSHLGVSLDDPPYQTASLALWLRRPPRERKSRGSNPACDGIFPGRIIPVI